MEENEHKARDEIENLNKEIQNLQKDKETQVGIISGLEKDKETQAILIEEFKGIHSQNQQQIEGLKSKIEV